VDRSAGKRGRLTAPEADRELEAGLAATTGFRAYYTKDLSAARRGVRFYSRARERSAWPKRGTGGGRYGVGKGRIALRSLDGGSQSRRRPVGPMLADSRRRSRRCRMTSTTGSRSATATCGASDEPALAADQRPFNALLHRLRCADLRAIFRPCSRALDSRRGASSSTVHCPARTNRCATRTRYTPRGFATPPSTPWVSYTERVDHRPGADPLRNDGLSPFEGRAKPFAPARDRRYTPRLAALRTTRPRAGRGCRQLRCAPLDETSETMVCTSGPAVVRAGVAPKPARDLAFVTIRWRAISIVAWA